MDNFRVYEDNGGGIHVVAGNRVSPNWQGMDPSDFRMEFYEGFPDVDWDGEYNPEEFGGVSEEEMIREIEKHDTVIADITDGTVTLYLKNMGAEARCLFGIPEWIEP